LPPSADGPVHVACALAFVSDIAVTRSLYRDR
jgi:hypothetical protein